MFTVTTAHMVKCSSDSIPIFFTADFIKIEEKIDTKPKGLQIQNFEPATCRSTKGLHGLGAEGEWTTQQLTQPVDVVFPARWIKRKGSRGVSKLGSREEALDLGGHQDSAALWAAKP